jgi:PKD repeat protein
VFFNASASTATAPRTIASYAWDFGDGTPPGSGVTPTHAYTNLGTFTVTLIVTDDLGQKGTSSKTVTVAPLVAEFTFSPTDPTVIVTTVNFDGTPSSPSSGITTYFWDFGDGSTCTNAACPGGVTGKAQHVFTTANTFTVRLTVTATGGQTATVAKTVTVKP